MGGCQKGGEGGLVGLGEIGEGVKRSLLKIAQQSLILETKA